MLNELFFKKQLDIFVSVWQSFENLSKKPEFMALAMLRQNTEKFIAETQFHLPGI
jgi:hypothetical protein